MTVTADTATAGKVRPVRQYDDTWDLIGDRARNHSEFVRDMTEAGLDRARCFRCFTLVPVEFRDLSGHPLAYWVDVSHKTVTAQSCRAHEPVTVGAGQDAGEPPARGAGRKAAAREKPPAARTEPSRAAAGTAVFLEPVPHAEPVVASPVPEVPARGKRGRA